MIHEASVSSLPLRHRLLSGPSCWSRLIAANCASVNGLSPRASNSRMRARRMALLVPILPLYIEASFGSRKWLVCVAVPDSTTFMLNFPSSPISTISTFRRSETMKNEVRAWEKISSASARKRIDARIVRQDPRHDAVLARLADSVLPGDVGGS